MTGLLAGALGESHRAGVGGRAAPHIRNTP
jgi:hypothetical protein